MTETQGLGRRLARYRKRLGFDSAKALSDATGGRVSESVLQNIESGRKADVSVAQLLEISRALGVSPLLLLAPLESPTATMDLAGLSPNWARMTSAEFDAWVRGTDPVRGGRAPVLHLRWQIEQIRRLTRELEDWRVADVARRGAEMVDKFTHTRTPVTDIAALDQQQRQVRIDLLCADLEDSVELGWVERPWRHDIPS